jgi:transposase
VTPDGDLLYWAFPGTMKAEKFIAFLKHLVSEASGKIIVFADRHQAHEAQAVEAWLEGRESQIEVEWLPRYSPEYNADEFLNNDLKQVLTKSRCLRAHRLFVRRSVASWIGSPRCRLECKATSSKQKSIWASSNTSTFISD